MKPKVIFMGESEEMQVGKVTHYFPKMGVAIIEVTDGSVKVGDALHFKGHATDFWQKVDSMQIDYENVAIAEPGQNVGVKVERHVRQNYLVFKRI